MASFATLAEILLAGRVVTRAQWEAARQAGGENLAAILDNLVASPPHWWDRKGSTPPGLSDYQRDMIELRTQSNELDQLRRDLTLNQFLLLNKLGQGGQGAVYRARQINPPRFAAIKTLIRDTESRRQRFEHEARAMMRIQHPSVARFYLYERVRDALGEPTNEYLIAMELVHGTDLFRLVHRAGRVPWTFAVHWVIELLGGLAAIHRNGFVHRDVKPENVMIVGPHPGLGVAPDQTAAKLLDFGAVKSVGDAAEDAVVDKVFVGTMEYAAPEQWRGKLESASDIYSLGGALHFMLTRRTPFQKPQRDRQAYMQSHLRDPIPDLTRYNPDVPASLVPLFERMMAKDPDERGTAAELAQEFEQLLEREAGIVRSAPVITAPKKSKPREALKPTRVVSPQEAVEPRNPLARLADSVLVRLERTFIAGYQPPLPDSELTIAERLIALLRQPLVIVVLGVLLGLSLLLMFL